MKIVKLSIFALTMGLFIASCGNNEAEETVEEETMEETTDMAPMAEEVPAADTAMMVDSAAMTTESVN